MDSRDHAKFKPSASRAREREKESNRSDRCYYYSSSEEVEERLTMVDADGAMVYLEREEAAREGGRQRESVVRSVEASTRRGKVG